MKVLVTPGAERQLKHLSKLDRLIVTRKISTFSNIKTILSAEKIKRYKNAYRVRVGDLRIIYTKNKNKIYIVLIAHRNDVYKLVERFLK